ncbi:baculoviral IAP repeat-containing protein 3-like [Ylistrum balloti]|uniref:baculoviral IAP repeat-containing protein 3-like n=1 Tax=Ylistrum balloti TaxID=509963 RepID=UPI002905F6BB|nr:baculoviral IAP repeat-containing protein 3-like [Ylistrum balloti]
MSGSMTSTPYESLDSIEAHHSAHTVEEFEAAAGCGHRGEECNEGAEKSFKKRDVTELPAASVEKDNVTVSPKTNSTNVTVQRNTNSPNVTVQRNTNSPNVTVQRNTNSNVNVPRNENSPNGQEERALSGNAPLNKAVTKHPGYADELKRRGTFRNWPARLQQSPEIMSAAGFFFSMNGDSVRCYVCGIGLRNWDQDDNPWVEHARWSPKCAYVLEKKGQTFIDLVQEAVRNAELQQALKENNERHVIGGYQAQGASNSKSQVDSDNPENFNAKSTRPGRPDQFPTDAERKNPLLCDAAQSVLNMGYLPRVVKQCLDELLKLEGWHAVSGRKLMKMIMEKEEVGDLDPDLSVVPSQRPRKRLKEKISVPKARLEQENATLKERTTCKICLQNPVAIVFLPCGHLVSCAQCAPALKVCPICRGPMKATVRISFG